MTFFFFQLAVIAHSYSKCHLQLKTSNKIFFIANALRQFSGLLKILSYGEMNGHESCGLYIFGFYSAVRSIENVWRFYKLDYYLIK